MNDQISYLDTSKHSEFMDKFDLKLLMDLKNDMRAKIEELESKMAGKATVNEAVDKLGEEIAYDIN